MLSQLVALCHNAFNELSEMVLSISFCSIGCVLATIFCGEARIHVFSNTQKSFLEIPPRDNLIRFINKFLIFPKSKLRKYE